jgi:hypothetical protein
MSEFNHPAKILFEIVVGKVKAVVHRRRIGATWIFTVNVIRCCEPYPTWSAEYGFIHADVEDVMEAMAHARRWIRDHPPLYRIRLR